MEILPTATSPMANPWVIGGLIIGGVAMGGLGYLAYCERQRANEAIAKYNKRVTRNVTHNTYVTTVMVNDVDIKSTSKPIHGTGEFRLEKLDPTGDGQ